jgi:hypothetical protein
MGIRAFMCAAALGVLKSKNFLLGNWQFVPSRFSFQIWDFTPVKIDRLLHFIVHRLAQLLVASSSFLMTDDPMTRCLICINLRSSAEIRGKDSLS